MDQLHNSLPIILLLLAGVAFVHALLSEARCELAETELLTAPASST